jgi:CRP-like cAMP-binding protein
MLITQTHIAQLKKTKLFEGITPDEAGGVLRCAGGRFAVYEKGDVIIGEQERVCDVGVILSGRVYAYRLDDCGKRIIISCLEAGATFGEVLSASAKGVSPFTVTAEEAVAALFIPFKKAAFVCGKSCPGHERLLLNLFDIISVKFFGLQNRINCIIRPTLREKILFYLNGAKGGGTGSFTIPFDRAGLADYLNAERSALSRELSQMKKEGLIDYYRNSFKVTADE